MLQLKTNHLLRKLLWPLDESESALVQQNCVASLLNAIVSHTEGRKYFDGIPTVDAFTAGALGSSLIERNTLDSLIAAMAKLSISGYHRHEFGKCGEYSSRSGNSRGFAEIKSFFAIRRAVGVAAGPHARRGILGKRILFQIRTSTAVESDIRHEIVCTSQRPHDGTHGDCL